MSGTMRINGQEITATHFAYDGCHKIFLLDSMERAGEMGGYGYDIVPISQLPEVWEQTCGLRFINWANLGETVVEQAYETEPVFEWVPA